MSEFCKILGIKEDSNLDEIRDAYLEFIKRCYSYIMRGINFIEVVQMEQLILIVSALYDRAEEEACHKIINDVIERVCAKADEEDAKRKEEKRIIEEKMRIEREAEEERIRIEHARFNAIYEEKLREAKIQWVREKIGLRNHNMSDDELVEMYNISVRTTNLILMELASTEFDSQIQQCGSEWISVGEGFYLIGKNYALEKVNPSKI